MPVDKTLIRDDLKRDEGFRARVYDDATGKDLKPGDTLVGNPTAAYGRNLLGRGLTEPEGEILLADDIETICSDLDQFAPWWRDRPEPVTRGLANVCMMGVRHFIDKNPMTMARLHSGDYAAAGAELLNGPYRAQVGDRAVRIAKLWADAATPKGAVA
jgi:hypothetical protein